MAPAARGKRLPVLETAVADLGLVPLDKRDADELFALIIANRTHLRRWLPWIDGVQSAGDTSAYVRNALELQRLGLRVDYTLRLRGRLIGTIAYHTLQPAHRSGVIGYWLELASSRRGYMTAAVERLVTYGFTELDLNRIEVRVAVGNRASERICTRLGFKEEGILREAEWLYDRFVDLQVRSLLRSEWAAQVFVGQGHRGLRRDGGRP
ncbi:MAG: GNAT family N-acetyltransferase [Verrucomicrobia bacterium]|nr:GNAT family N-acetyltransferase [Verrucomicrobiota bacterium]